MCALRWNFSTKATPAGTKFTGNFGKVAFLVKLRANILPGTKKCGHSREVAVVERWRLVTVVVFPLTFLLFCVISSVSPSIEPKSQEIFISSTKPALLPCNHSGFPSPSVYWTVTHFGVPKNITKGDPVSLTSNVGGKFVVQELEVFENGTLHIFKVDYPHSKKEYRCTAVNRLGVAKGDVRLTVVGGTPVCFFVCLFVFFNFALYMYKRG